MPSLINPYVLLGIVLALLSSFGFGHHSGYTQRDAEMQVEIARMNEQSRATEQRRQAEANATANQLRKANQDAYSEITRLNAGVASGAVRLSVAARCVQASTDTGAASGSSSEARAELDPTAAQQLIAIAAEGDEAIRQLNSCIDIYNQVRSNQ